MKRIDQLKFKVDLDWKIRFNRLDDIFASSEFLLLFAEWIKTDIGHQWLESNDSKKYKEWQMGV